MLLLQRYSFDAATFTEFQTLMFVLTATALSVGAIVSEREQARRAFQDAEERLKRKEADAIRARRLNLVSAMASALAHEIDHRSPRFGRWLGRYNTSCAAALRT